MKFIVTFLCITAVCVSGVTEDDDPTADYRIGDRFFYFPDSEGKLYLVDSQEPVDDDFIRSHSNSDNTYLLYTRSNPHSPQNLVWGDPNSVNNSFFDPAKETVFFVHGWNGNGFSTTGRLITEALDPAGPLWSLDSNHIVKTDGQYVEVIHTNSGFLGVIKPCGHADFYPNGGTFMPGCTSNSCNHRRSVEYMASTVKNNHLNTNECNFMLEMTLDSCSGPLYPMGNSDLTKSGSGLFRVNTEQNYPF